MLHAASLYVEYTDGVDMRLPMSDWWMWKVLDVWLCVCKRRWTFPSHTHWKGPSFLAEHWEILAEALPYLLANWVLVGEDDHRYISAVYIIIMWIHSIWTLCQSLPTVLHVTHVNDCLPKASSNASENLLNALDTMLWKLTIFTNSAQISVYNFMLRHCHYFVWISRYALIKFEQCKLFFTLSPVNNWLML